MDTIRLRFPYGWDNIPQDIRELFFCEVIGARELGKIGETKSSRPVRTNNKWRKERQKEGIYTPKYWIETDFVDSSKTYFVLEVSLPKLIFGTSAKGLKNSDFEPVVKAIQDFCASVGIKIFERLIMDTVPMAVAFGKNTDITDFATCEQAVAILSRFNDRFRSDCYTYRPKLGGVELYFNTKSSTFKVYDKFREIKNNAITPEERKIVEAAQDTGKDTWICEVIRTELTLKSSTSIRRKLGPYVQGEPTFRKIFQEALWNELLKNEVERIFNHPLGEFIFLSTLQSKTIESLLKKQVNHRATRLWLKDMIEKVQKEGGTKGIRRYYEENYKSRQTYYNHLKQLERLLAKLDLSKLGNLSATQFHSFYLSEFGIDNSRPNTLF